MRKERVEKLSREKRDKIVIENFGFSNQSPKSRCAQKKASHHHRLAYHLFTTRHDWKQLQIVIILCVMSQLRTEKLLPIIEWMSDTHNFFLCTNALQTSKELPEKKVNFVYFFILLCWATSLSCLSWRLYGDKCEAKSIFFLISNSSEFSYAYSTWRRVKVDNGNSVYCKKNGCCII